MKEEARNQELAMSGEHRDLADRESTWVSDVVDLALGAGMIVAGLAVIAMMILMTIFAKVDWHVWLIGIIVFIFSCAVGGIMMVKARRNLRNRK